MNNASEPIAYQLRRILRNWIGRGKTHHPRRPMARPVTAEGRVDRGGRNEHGPDCPRPGVPLTYSADPDAVLHRISGRWYKGGHGSSSSVGLFFPLSDLDSDDHRSLMIQLAQGWNTMSEDMAAELLAVLNGAREEEG